jgi:hypothetical protein
MHKVYYSVEWEANPGRQRKFGWGRIDIYLNSDVDLTENASSIIRSVKHSFPDWDLLILANVPKYLHLRLTDRGTGMAGAAMRKYTQGTAKKVKSLVRNLIKQMGFKPVLRK